MKLVEDITYPLRIPGDYLFFKWPLGFGGGNARERGHLE